MTSFIDRRTLLTGLAVVPLASSAGKAAESGLRVIASGLEFPEGVVSTLDGGALFVEIGAGRLSRVTAEGKLSRIADTGLGPNGATIGPDGAIYVANDGGLLFDRPGGGWAVASRPGVPANYTGGLIQRIDPKTGSVKTLYSNIGTHRLCAPNDILCDSWGGLWFSDTGRSYPRSHDHGGLYWAKLDGSEIREIAYPLLTPNGLALSPDRKTLYVASSSLRQITAYNLIGPGIVESANGRPVSRIVASIGGDLAFDNIAVEAGGNIVVAAVRSGQLLVINPSGEVVETVKVPDPLVTALAFGGTDMRKLFVTLSGTGKLIVLDWPRAGLPPLHRI